MHFIGLGKTSFTPISFFQAEIESEDSKYEISVFLINDNSIDFDKIIGTDIIQLGTIIISFNSF